VDSSPDDVVIGRDLMEALGIVLNFKTKTVQWDDCSTQLNTGSHSVNLEENHVDPEIQHEFKEVADTVVQPSALLPDNLPGAIAARFLPLITQYQGLYNSRLGRMRFDDYVLPFSADFKSVHAKSYPIARSMEEKAKAENPATHST
jgi:hypothetical protein